MSRARVLERVCSRRRLAGLLAVGTALLVVVLSEGVFPYLTSNHDEAVYLQQAELLLNGQLHLSPPVPESFRPWFFVADGSEFYPKYTPVTAAIFAVGGLLGSYTIALGLVAGAVVALSYGVVAELFDRTTAVVAAGLVATAPLFVVNASVFLSYVPTFALNLCFAWAYLRADRTGDWRYGALAGGASGLAFFARPYTAVLFALPFVAHACWTLRGFDRQPIVRQGATAAVGLCGVALAVGYNAVVTGDPFVFPYQAFAPLDGLGFGRRRILGYERTYDLALALRANARVLWAYVTDWSVAAPFGLVLAGGGLGTVVRNRLNARRLALAGLFLSIPLGNLYFWGNVNVLGTLADPNDGLISFLGPYYHVGLLLPTAAFAAVAVVSIGRRVAALRRRTSGTASVAVTTLVLVASVGGVAVAGGAVAEPLSDNYEVTKQYERAYEPFDRSFDDALVLLPTPYGRWLNHPFQALRNQPGYDSNVVYALQHRQFDVRDAFPERTLYRYVYRGQWVPYNGQAVTPRLQPVSVARGDSVGFTVSVGIPRYTEAVEMRLTSGAATASASASMPSDGIDVRTTVANGSVTATSAAFAEPLSVALDAEEPVTLTAFIDYGSLGSFEYVVDAPIDNRSGSYRILSPRLEVCQSPRRCGGEAAYVPGEHRSGVWMNASVHAEGGSS
jgi:hypothetical protein